MHICFMNAFAAAAAPSVYPWLTAVLQHLLSTHALPSSTVTHELALVFCTHMLQGLGFGKLLPQPLAVTQFFNGIDGRTIDENPQFLHVLYRKLAGAGKFSMVCEGENCVQITNLLLSAIQSEINFYMPGGQFSPPVASGALSLNASMHAIRLWKCCGTFEMLPLSAQDAMLCNLDISSHSGHSDVLVPLEQLLKQHKLTPERSWNYCPTCHTQAPPVTTKLYDIAVTGASYSIVRGLAEQSVGTDVLCEQPNTVMLALKRDDGSFGSSSFNFSSVTLNRSLLGATDQFLDILVVNVVKMTPEGRLLVVDMKVNRAQLSSVVINSVNQDKTALQLESTLSHYVAVVMGPGGSLVKIDDERVAQMGLVEKQSIVAAVASKAELLFFNFSAPATQSIGPPSQPALDAFVADVLRNEHFLSEVLFRSGHSRMLVGNFEAHRFMNALACFNKDGGFEREKLYGRPHAGVVQRQFFQRGSAWLARMKESCSIIIDSETVASMMRTLTAECNQAAELDFGRMIALGCTNLFKLDNVLQHPPLLLENELFRADLTNAWVTDIRDDSKRPQPLNISFFACFLNPILKWRRFRPGVLGVPPETLTAISQAMLQHFKDGGSSDTVSAYVRAKFPPPSSYGAAVQAHELLYAHETSSDVRHSDLKDTMAASLPHVGSAAAPPAPIKITGKEEESRLFILTGMVKRNFLKGVWVFSSFYCLFLLAVLLHFCSSICSLPLTFCC